MMNPTPDTLLFLRESGLVLIAFSVIMLILALSHRMILLWSVYKPKLVYTSLERWVTTFEVLFWWLLIIGVIIRIADQSNDNLYYLSDIWLIFFAVLVLACTNIMKNSYLFGGNFIYRYLRRKLRDIAARDSDNASFGVLVIPVVFISFLFMTGTGWAIATVLVLVIITILIFILYKIAIEVESLDE